MLKKLLCKHEFMHYHSGKEYSVFYGQWYTVHYFVCKCGRTKYLDELGISEFGRKISKKVNKEKALGVDNSIYDKDELRFINRIYQGKTAYYVRKELGRLKIKV